jgi:hypothetical protein
MICREKLLRSLKFYLNPFIKLKSLFWKVKTPSKDIKILKRKRVLFGKTLKGYKFSRFLFNIQSNLHG